MASGVPREGADAIAFTLECIDAVAEEFVEQSRMAKFFDWIAYPQRGMLEHSWDSSNNDRSRRPLAIDDIDAVKNGSWYRLGVGYRHFLGPNANSPHAELGAFFFYFGDQMKAKLAQRLGDWFPDWQKDPNVTRRAESAHFKDATRAELASSVADRRAEIAANEARIAALDEEIESLDEALASLGEAAGSA